MLDCDVCGEPVELRPARYAEWVRIGERPRCRGCERLCGAKRPGTARGPEVLAVVEVGSLSIFWPRVKRGNANGALAKLRVRPDAAIPCEPRGGNGRE